MIPAIRESHKSSHHAMVPLFNDISRYLHYLFQHQRELILTLKIMEQSNQSCEYVTLVKITGGQKITERMKFWETKTWRRQLNLLLHGGYPTKQ
jgi:hypothetical protein